MLNKYDGGIIDYNAVINTANRLALYTENEEKILQEITKLFNEIDSYYSSDNKIIQDKKNNLIESLNTMLSNRKAIVNYLNRVLSSYLTMDEKAYLYYQKKDIN